MAERALFLPNLKPSRFAHVGVRSASVILLITLVAMAALIAAGAFAEAPPSVPSEGKGDLVLYETIVSAMRLGSPYYQAAHEALLAGGYGTLSVFNWRLPTLATVQSFMSPSSWTFSAGLVAAGAVILAIGAIGRHHGPATAAIAALTVSANLIIFTSSASAQFSEVVAGALILASIGAYGLRWNITGALLAIIAMFIRELSGVYALVCLYMAWRQRDTKQLALLTTGILAFALYFSWHYTSVQSRLGPYDIGYPDGWIQFGGLDFILATASFNGVFAVLPSWGTALILPLSLLGFAGGHPKTLRAALTLIGYLLAFAVVGKPFNYYWGAIYTPVMMIGLALAPAALRDLTCALLGKGPHRLPVNLSQQDSL